MSLLRTSEFNKMASNFKEQRQKSEFIQNKLNQTIQNETKEDFQKIQELIQSYNQKVQGILQREDKKVKQIEGYNREMQSTLHKTYEAFQETTQNILENNTLTPDQKEKQIQDISDYVMSSLYTHEEVDSFKRFAEGLMMLLPNTNEGFSQRVNALR
jgi:hypothetical protein